MTYIGRRPLRAMQTNTFKKAFRLANVLALVVAVLMVASRLFQPLAWLTLPVTWPGLFILGADETQERYGYWGELVLFWLCSLPCIAAYAWLLCRCWHRRRVAHDAA
jgi:hypothetical protein